MKIKQVKKGKNIVKIDKKQEWKLYNYTKITK